MKQPSRRELQKLAQETFGLDLNDVDIDSYKERLPGMVRTIDIIREEVILKSVEIYKRGSTVAKSIGL